MHPISVEVSSAFKTQARKSIFAIVLFIVTYLILFAVGVALVIGSAILGLTIAINYLSLWTILIGLGLLAMGGIVFFFLIKFLFSQQKVDRSNMKKIQESDAPELFAMIHEIVEQVDTHFPKNIYLSSEVNASVFYDSSFFSLFWPSRKNLVIGLGLVNSVNKEELKAVLGHEFGHFSQGSMRIGSYVYQFHRIIHNMLFENNSLDKAISGLSNVHGLIAIFVWIAVYIIRFIQWVLQLLYNLVYKSYMALSREMEYHADEIAAHVAGSSPMINALLRLDLAGNAYNTTMNYYLVDTSGKKKPDNFYPQHFYVMQEIAKDYDLELKEGLPQVKENTTLFQGNSKLILENQWASHPSTEDRVNRLQKLGIPQKSHTITLSAELFQEVEYWQKAFTALNFPSAQADDTPQSNSLDHFIKAIKEKKAQYQFPDLFKNYFDNRNLPVIKLDTLEPLTAEEQSSTTNDLFNENIQAKIKNLLSIRNDLQLIGQIEAGELQQKTFDYDGKKYKRKDAKKLKATLQTELEKGKKELEAHDRLIFKYHLHLAKQKDSADRFKSLYQSFGRHDYNYVKRMQLLQKMREATYFMQVQISYDEVQHYLKELAPVETAFKEALDQMLHEEDYSKVMTSEIRAQLEKYNSQKWRYFKHPNYLNESLNVLSYGMYYFEWLLNEAYFQKKRELLFFMEQLNQ